MKIHTIAILATAISLFAVDAYAQANHNTSRSNQRPGGVAAPADTDAPKPETTLRTKSSDVLANTSTSESKGCVMYSGALDQDCDGVADDKAVDATDYNSSRSNKADSISYGGGDDETPDPDDEGTKATDYNSSRSNKNPNK
ncbi:MAG: hypothetical protein ABJO36_10330 [Litorimonas sp.]